MGMLVDGKWIADDQRFRNSGDGNFIRPSTSFRSYVAADGSSGFAAEPNRYHLYVALSCPWAHRALLLRALKGLEDAISISIVAPWTLENGWSFESYPGATGDRANGFRYLYEVYLRAHQSYTGRVTVPVLWDTRTNTIVNNESAEIVRMLNSEFNAFARHPDDDYYPADLRGEIDELNALIYRAVNHGVYRAGFAGRQDKYEVAVADLFQTLDSLEERLSQRRYLCGEQVTEADWRLFPTLIRFDAVYYIHFKCSVRRLVDYPNLYDYTRELFQTPNVAATVNFEHIKHHYYGSHVRINPSSLVPVGPAPKFDIPHTRAAVSKKSEGISRVGFARAR
ncbi:MAG: glutathione S-transferase family protein [Alloacidobacterium sp.]